jgi:LysM repeat protein
MSWRLKETMNNRKSVCRLFSILILTCSFVLLTPPAEAFSQSDTETHTVRQGDTLFSIARQFDITVAELREWNDLAADDLSVGDVLRVAPPQEQGSVTHTVQPQETLFSISRQYNVTIAEIQQWNDIETTSLSTGQELIIYTDETPGSEEITVQQPVAIPDEPESRESIVAPTAAASTYYTVQSGDFLNRIASEHGMTTDELRQLNDLQDDLIRVGQRLVVRETRATPVVDEDFGESTPQGRFVNYRVESGENTDAILERFSMNLEELQALNPGSNVQSLSTGQRVTVILPPSRSFENPYRQSSGLRDLGDVSVNRYDDGDAATTTTSGELYNPDQLTAAHANMALGSIIYVENPENGRGVYVKINDRFSGDGIKLSHRAYEALDFISAGQATATIFQED